MAQVKSNWIAPDGTSMTTLSELPPGQFTKVPGSNVFINNSGDTLVYDSSTRSYSRVSLGPTLLAPSSSAHETKGLDMDDNNVSKQINSALKNHYNMTQTGAYKEGVFTDIKENSNPYKTLMRQNNIYKAGELDLYNKTYRFGYFEPAPLSKVKEFLFFTKPDLHIFGHEGGKLYPGSYDMNKMASSLASIPFWNSLKRNNLRTISALQSSLPKSLGGNPDDHFNHLLQNQCISNLEIPSLSSDMVETATNMYGVGFSYRGSSEASDDKPSFSLEFKDNKYLDVYYYFKAYEEYETLKHHGVIAPFTHYIENRVIHDQMAIYKFLVDEDMETILYFGKMYGVVPKSLPRDIFSGTSFDNGISYSIDFEAAFYEDMKPEIIRDFNALSYNYYNTRKYRIDIYNNQLDAVDMRAAKAAYVEVISNLDVNNVANANFIRRSPSGFVYKLRWRGDDVI